MSFCVFILLKFNFLKNHSKKTHEICAIIKVILCIVQ